MDPSTLPTWLEHALAYAAILITATTALHGFLGSIIPRLEALAAKTDWRGDDKAVRWLVRVYDGMTAALEVVRAILPRVSLGRVDGTDKAVAAKRMRRGGGVVPMLLAAAVGASAITGCAETGAERAENARAALDSTAITMVTLQETAIVTCDTTAEILIERAGSREQAEAVEAEIAEKCEAVYQTFRALKTMHAAALEAVNRVEDGRMDPSDLVALLMRLGSVAVEAQQAWSQLKAVLEQRSGDEDQVSRALEDVRRWSVAESEALGAS
ncbi:MAG: hypothetical protein ACOC9O_04325 [Myxococcota bacterium]